MPMKYAELHQWRGADRWRCRRRCERDGAAPIQIREAVTAHFEKEQQLFAHGIKVLSLFFIDEVAKYRRLRRAVKRRRANTRESSKRNTTPA